MKTKKVFNAEKFIEERRESGASEDDIAYSFTSWANECEGLTEDEMAKLGYVINEDWMAEVEVKVSSNLVYETNFKMKYQEALEIVKHPMKYGADKFGEAIVILQQAIDKAIKYDEKETPANAAYTDIGMNHRTTVYRYICLNCGDCSTKILNYCPRCGRRLELKNE